MSELSKVEKRLAEYYYQCKGEKRQLEISLKVETAKMQARIDELNELMFDIEGILELGKIKPIYEHFEKFEEQTGENT